MTECRANRSLAKALPLVALCAQLAACGGGGGGTASNVSPDTAAATDKEVVISGSVGDGPVVNAAVTVQSADGSVIRRETSDAFASYKLRMRKNNVLYPLIVKAEGGTDLVTGYAPDFTMTSVATSSEVKNLNINPFTTLIVRTAHKMSGGLTTANVNTARTNILRQLNFGLDTNIIQDVATVYVDGSNIAQIVKSSEAFGEMIRRTRDTLVGQGILANGDFVIDALAADVADGILDGQGVAGTNKRLSAIAVISSAQVLVESLSNNLLVGGVNATPAMDDAILQTQPTTLPDALTASVRVNAQMLTQAKNTVDAARAVAPSAALDNIAAVLDAIPVDSLPSEVEAVLPSSSSSELQAAVTMASAGGDTELDAINSTIASSYNTETPANTAPSISGAPSTAIQEGAVYSFIPTGGDVDGDALVYSVINRPIWLSFDTASGALTGTPSSANVGVYSNIVVSVSDGQVTTSLPAFNITVTAAQSTNRAPTITGTPATTVAEDLAYNFTPTASDPDASTTLAFSIVNRPSWATFNTTTGRLSGTPTNANVGTTSSIVISVSDGIVTTALPAFNLTVTNTNDAPTISGTPATSVAEDAVYSFQPTASDVDAGATLTFSIVNRPSWATFNTTTGRLSGTPTNANVGTTSSIVISVSDGIVTTALPAFNLTVTNTNDAPIISGTPATTVAEDSAYNFTPTASDPDAGTTLTFSIVNRPSWATFNTTTGRLSGTPTNANVGTTSSIVISVSDGSVTTALPAFNLTVTNTNDAPTISGTPAVSVDVNSAYSFQPTASDVDAGTILTYSIVNRPSWATFNTSTGRLSGTPTSAGTTSNIVISVGDGTVSTSLPAFSITVNGSASVQATLSWNAPVARTDGTALSMAEIGGYTIRYGTSQSNLSNSVNVADPYTTQRTIDNLTSGTYYFAVMAYDTQGNQSQLSGVISTTIQ